MSKKDDLERQRLLAAIEAQQAEDEEETIPVADMRAGDLFRQILDVMAEQQTDSTDLRHSFESGASVTFRITVVDVDHGGAGETKH